MNHLDHTLSKDTYFDIARHKYRDAKHINKFGWHDTVNTAWKAIWDGSSPYPYTAAATPALLTSTSVDDTGAIIEIQGLDQDYNLQVENVTVGGDPSTTSFKRIFRMIVKVPATGLTNVGEISATVDLNVIAVIKAEAGQTLMALYTIPAGYTGYLVKFQGSVAKQKEVTFRIKARPFGGAFNVKGQFGTFGVPVTYDYPIPLEFTEKTDIEVQAMAGATTDAGAVFDIVLVENA